MLVSPLCSETNAFQILAVLDRIIHRPDIQRRIAILLHRAPPLEPVVEQDLAHRLELHIALPEIAENALPTGLIAPGALGDDIRLHHRVDVLEMHVGNAVHVPRHKGHRVEPGIGVMPGIETDLQDIFRNFL